MKGEKKEEKKRKGSKRKLNFGANGLLGLCKVRVPVSVCEIYIERSISSALVGIPRIKKLQASVHDVSSIHLP
jgi:hypothetical protein